MPDASLVNIYKTLERLERGQEKVVELLEKVANQDARIDHLEKQTETHIDMFDQLFTRMREIEAAWIKVNQFMSIITSRAVVIFFMGLLCLVGVGTALDLIYHLDTMKAIIQFVRG